jgi:hypothetical protein
VVINRLSALPHKKNLGILSPVSGHSETKSPVTGLEIVVFSANVTFFVCEKPSLQNNVTTVTKNKKVFLNRFTKLIWDSIYIKFF